MKLFVIPNKGNTCFFNSALQLMATMFLDPFIYKYYSQLTSLHYLFSIYNELIVSNDISLPSLKIMISKYKLTDKSYQFGKTGDADEVFRNVYNYIDESIISNHISCDPEKPSRYLFVNLQQYPKFNIEIIKTINQKKYLLVSAIIYNGGHWTSLRLIKNKIGLHDYYYFNDFQSMKLSANQLSGLISKQLVTVCYIKN